MTNNNSQNLETNKIAIVLLLLFFIALALGLLYKTYSQFLTLGILEKELIIFKWDPGLIPFIFLAPAYLTMLAMFVKRLKGTATAKDSSTTIKVILVNFPVFILAHWLLVWQQSNWLLDKGYHKCPWYSGSTIGAPTVWVFNPNYCYKSGFKVRIELMEWASQMAKENKNITPKDVSNKIDYFLENL